MVRSIVRRVRPGRHIAFVAFAALTGAASLARWATYHTRSLDMAYYVRLVWGIGHGHLDNPVVGATNLLGLHLEPVLLPLAILGRVFPVAPMLLVVQALGAAAAIYPAARIAERRIGAWWPALAILLLPSVSRCVDYDFHPSTIAIWPLLECVDALDAGDWRRGAIWAAIALGFREDVGLQLAAIAATLAIWPRAAGERRSAIVLGAVGLVWFFGYVLLVQPHWLPDQKTGSYGAHFAAVGGAATGAGGVLASALAHPIALLRYLFTGDRPTYPLLLLASVAFLPLASPRWLAGALPIVAINLLSSFPRVRTIQAHYATATAPFLVAAALCGAGRLRARLKLVPAAALVVASAGFWWFRGLAPGSPEFALKNYRKDAHARAARDLVVEVPKDASVTAVPKLLAHLAERPICYDVDHARGPTVVTLYDP
jgi:uncharacterized membrane protein